MINFLVFFYSCDAVSRQLPAQGEVAMRFMASPFEGAGEKASLCRYTNKTIYFKVLHVYKQTIPNADL